MMSLQDIESQHAWLSGLIITKGHFTEEQSSLHDAEYLEHSDVVR